MLFRSEDCKKFIEKVVSELNYIVKTYPVDATEMIFEYKHSLSLDYAIGVVNRRKTALKQEAEALKLAQSKQQEATAHAAEVEQLAAPTVSNSEMVEAKPETEKVYQLVFKVWGTKDRLKTLKQFLKDGGYQYE